MLGIVSALKHWQYLLLAAEKIIEVFCDHANLRYFRSNHQVTSRHVRWMETLGAFNFKILAVPGKDNTAADALSRRADYAEEKVTVEQVLPGPEFFNSIVTEDQDETYHNTFPGRRRSDSRF